VSLDDGASRVGPFEDDDFSFEIRELVQLAIDGTELKIGRQTSDDRDLLLGCQDSRKKGQDSKAGKKKGSFWSVERHVITSFKI
jgi:hypothetical protein